MVKSAEILLSWKFDNRFAADLPVSPNKLDHIIMEVDHIIIIMYEFDHNTNY